MEDVSFKNFDDIEQKSARLEYQEKQRKNIADTEEQKYESDDNTTNIGISCCFDAPLMSPEEVFFMEKRKKIAGADIRL